MKKIKLVFSGILIMIIASANFAKANNSSFEKSFNARSAETLSLTSRNSDVEILVWDKDEIKISGEISYGEASEDDIRKLLAAFENFDINASRKTITVDLGFIKSSTMKSNKQTITLLSGSKISMKNGNIKARYKICIPSRMSVDINDSYGSVSVESLNTNAKIILFNSKLAAEGFNDVNIESKYSQIKINKAAAIKISSFNDKFALEQLSSMDIESKYSNFNINSNIKDATLDIFNGKINMRDVENMKISAKYSQLNIGASDKIAVKTAFNSTFNIDKVNYLKCDEYKYGSINIEEITASAEFTTVFNASINANAGALLNNFSGKFEYGSINLKLDSATQYNLSYIAKYGNVKFPTEKFTSKLISDKTKVNHTFEGSTSRDAKCNIKLNTFNTNVNIK